MESCGFRFLADSGNRKLYSSDEPCYTIYRTGSAYADRWYCNHAEISAVAWRCGRCIVDGIVVILLLMLLVKGPKYQKKIKYRYDIPLIIAGCCGFCRK